LQGGVFAVTTEAEFIQALHFEKKIAHCPDFDGWIGILLGETFKNGCWIFKEMNSSHVPQTACGEKDFMIGKARFMGTQSYFTKLVNALLKPCLIYPLGAKGAFIDKGRKQLRLASTPEDSHNKSSFSTRKPDFTAYKIGSAGEYAISFFGDVKPFAGDERIDFTDAEVGHVIDMGFEFMRHVQPLRPFLIVFLTDMRRWQFFKIVRLENKSFEVQVSSIRVDAKGFSAFFGLLSSSMTQLGFVDMIMHGVSDLKLLYAGKKNLFSLEFF
jgi:hypothetical protein